MSRTAKPVAPGDERLVVHLRLPRWALEALKARAQSERRTMSFALEGAIARWPEAKQFTSMKGERR